MIILTFMPICGEVGGIKMIMNIPQVLLMYVTLTSILHLKSCEFMSIVTKVQEALRRKEGPLGKL